MPTDKKGQKADVRALYTEKWNKQNQTRLNLVCESTQKKKPHEIVRGKTNTASFKRRRILDPPLFFEPGTNAVVANAGLRLRGLMLIFVLVFF